MLVNQLDRNNLDKYFCFFFIGQIGFAVIILLFFYYFATILILGAQVNAFCFEHYKPLSDSLGTYISHTYGDRSADDPTRPLFENEGNIQQSPTTTTTSGRSPQRNVWLNKLWPSKITSSTEQEEERENTA